MSDWFSSVLSSVSSSVTQTLESVKSDLGEFVGTIRGDTQQVLTDTITTLHTEASVHDATDKEEEEGARVVPTLNAIKKAVHNVVEKVASGIEENESAPLPTPGSAKRVARGSQSLTPSRLDAMPAHLTRAFYLTPPEGSPEEFEMWCSGFDVQTHTDEISKLLSHDEQIRKLHTELIPLHMSYVSFWQRYYYRLHQCQIKEKKRLALVERMNADKEEMSFGDWDEDEKLMEEIDKAAPGNNVPTGDASEDVFDELDKALAEARPAEEDDLEAAIDRAITPQKPVHIVPQAVQSSSSLTPVVVDVSSVPEPLAPVPFPSEEALAQEEEEQQQQQQQQNMEEREKVEHTVRNGASEEQAVVEAATTADTKKGDMFNWDLDLDTPVKDKKPPASSSSVSESESVGSFEVIESPKGSSAGAVASAPAKAATQAQAGEEGEDWGDW